MRFVCLKRFAFRLLENRCVYVLLSHLEIFIPLRDSYDLLLGCLRINAVIFQRYSTTERFALRLFTMYLSSE